MTRHYALLLYQVCLELVSLFGIGKYCLVLLGSVWIGWRNISDLREYQCCFINLKLHRSYDIMHETFFISIEEGKTLSLSWHYIVSIEYLLR